MKFWKLEIVRPEITDTAETEILLLSDKCREAIYTVEPLKEQRLLEITRRQN